MFQRAWLGAIHCRTLGTGLGPVWWRRCRLSATSHQKVVDESVRPRIIQHAVHLHGDTLGWVSFFSLARLVSSSSGNVFRGNTKVGWPVRDRPADRWPAKEELWRTEHGPQGGANHFMHRLVLGVMRFCKRDKGFDFFVRYRPAEGLGASRLMMSAGALWDPWWAVSSRCDAAVPWDLYAGSNCGYALGAILPPVGPRFSAT